MVEPTTYVVSDLHVGDARQSEATFYHLLDVLGDICRHWLPGDTLVLAGDAIDRTPAFKFNDRHRIFFRALKCFDNVIWLGGNHDWDWLGLEDSLATHIKWKQGHNFKSGGRTVHISHGHEEDFNATYFPWFDRVGGWFVRWCYRAFKVNFHKWFSPKSFKFGKMEQKLVDRYASADVVITGHTHFPGEYKLPEGDRVYINTGDWLDPDHCSLVAVRGGEAQLLAMPAPKQ